VNERRVLAPFGRRRLEIVEARAVGAYRLLAAADPAGPTPQPGQFYMLAAAERWGAGEDERPWLPRAFSFLRARRRATASGGVIAGSCARSTLRQAASLPETVRDAERTEMVLEFLLEAVGPGTARLAELGPGDGLHVLGPLGVGFSAPDREQRAVLCGGGIGVVPLAGWEDELEHPTTLLGFRDAEHAPAAALFADPRVATDDGSVGHHGLVTDLLAREIDARTVVYACGPPPMLEAVRALCGERDVPAQLALETGMACGYGACFGCAVATREGYVRLCLEGPVMDARMLEAVG
jgi:NAD(P)H-flavin reductase